MSISNVKTEQVRESANPLANQPMSPLIHFMQVFESLGIHNLDLLDEIYHPQIVFQDPAHRIEGWPALRGYYQQLYLNVKRCEFKMHHWLEGEDEAFIQWTMHLSHPRLAGGELRSTQGCTRLVFEQGRVIEHRDYFDLGQMLYEGLPVLGSAVRMVKGRLGQ